MALRPLRTRLTLVVTLTALGCGSPQPPAPQAPPPPTPPAAPVTVADAGAAGAAAASPWTGLDRAALSRIVTDGVRARLHEVQPDFDLDHLAQYRADPAHAPEISGRAADRLVDLALVDVVAGRLDDAERTIRLVRARARNRNLAFTANTLLSEIKRRGAGEGAEAQQHAVEAVFRELPVARFGAATVVYQIFQAPAQLDARLGQVHSQLVSMDTARDALYFGEFMPGIVAHRPVFLAAIDAVRAANNARPAVPDHDFGPVDLAGARDAHETAVGVWDLGTNPELFASQLYANPDEQPNGRDDDGNGLVDDIHGVVADGDAPNTALLYDPGAETVQRYAPFLRGVMDLRAGMASTEAARRVLELQRAVTDVAGLRDLERHLDAIGEWGHGTHVAGLMLRQNPFARLAIFRSAWAGERRPYFERGPTDAELDAERRNMDAVADFIHRHHLRVVNASLGFSVEYLEDELRHERDRYHTDDEVRARARAVQDRRRANWEAVFARCPDTLFVVAAGNSNQDVVEYGEVPAASVAANLLVVGAVDRFGNWATFTNSNPERVRLFAHGVEVESVIPSGERVPLSGTSMASPNVANLAGKLFALDPALTPARAITLMTETGDPIAAPFGGRIANEARAVARLRRERGSARPTLPPPAHPPARPPARPPVRPAH